MKIGTAVLASLLAASAQASYKTVVETPQYRAEVHESTAAARQCLGLGYAQDFFIDLKNHELSNIIAQDDCANESSGVEKIQLFKDKQLCECPEYKEFASGLVEQVRAEAWKEKRKEYAQSLAQRVMDQAQIADKGVNVDGQLYTIFTTYNPKSDFGLLSYSDKEGSKGFALYLFKNTQKGIDVRILMDDADGVPDQVMHYFEKYNQGPLRTITGRIRDAIAKQKVKIETPSAEDIKFYDDWFRKVGSGRVKL